MVLSTGMTLRLLASRPSGLAALPPFPTCLLTCCRTDRFDAPAKTILRLGHTLSEEWCSGAD